MARRVARHVEHHDGAVAEHVFVLRDLLGFACAVEPVLERRRIGRARRRRALEHVPVALPDQQRRLRERSGLAGVIAVIVADADILDLLGLDLQLRELLDQRDLDRRARRRRARRRGRIAGIPDHVVICMADEIAARGQLQLLALVRHRVREAPDVGRPALLEQSKRVSDTSAGACAKTGNAAAQTSAPAMEQRIVRSVMPLSSRIR